MLRFLTIYIISAISLVTIAAAQDPVANWFQIPNDQSAIALVVKDEPKKSMLIVKDGGGAKLDSVEWLPGLPLVRQYRVPPGDYRLNVDGVGVFLAEARAGEVSYLVLQDDPSNGFFAAMKAGKYNSAAFTELLGTINSKVGYDAIKPVYFAPAKNELYFAFEPPGVRPPPE